jgi:ABC-type uncharacterized transport system ATPase component
MAMLDGCSSALEHYFQTLCVRDHHTAPLDCGERVICLDCGEVVERIPQEAAQLTLIAHLDLDNWSNSVIEVRTD